MKNINWDNVQEATDFERIKPGGYIATILTVEDDPAKEYLKMELDISEGEYAGYYSDLAANKNFWGLTLYRSYKESAQGFFKRFKNDVEKSNAGYTFNNDEKTLVRKQVGVILREEEYVANDGSVKTRIIISNTKPVSDIKAGNFKVPDLKKLDDKSIDPPAGFTANTDDTPF